MANYPQELAQDAVCQSHTGHMTGLWFLPARPLRLNTNEWMRESLRANEANRKGLFKILPKESRHEANLIFTYCSWMKRKKKLVSKEKNILFYCINLRRQVRLPKLVQLSTPWMETWLLAGWSKNGCSNSSRWKRCFLLKSVQTDSQNRLRGQPNSLTIRTSESFSQE